MTTVDPDQSELPFMSPAEIWDQDVARRTLDELFCLARKYNSSKAYRELMEFVARFRFYAPYNAMLVHIQMPGARYVASPRRWLREYDRHIKAEARPLVILQPMGPVMFVFDVSDTEQGKHALPLPPDVDRPFEILSGKVGSEYSQTIKNAIRDGIEIVERADGSQRAGSIQSIAAGRFLDFQVKDGPKPEHVRVPKRYDLILNSKLSTEAKYVTLVHELAHLYCGHLGTPNEKWWPDRRGLGKVVCEFEAESVCYLVCTRLRIKNPSDEYLSGYVKNCDSLPSISLDCVMKSAGLVEQMGRERFKPRKEKGK